MSAVAAGQSQGSTLPEPRPEFDRLCTVTIQGGGIFGLSLLGQLKAVEEFGLRPVAYAGTSAGAVIAALAWAGYSADEILEKLKERARRRSLAALLGRFPSGRPGARMTPVRLWLHVNGILHTLAVIVVGHRQASTPRRTKVRTVRSRIERAARPLRAGWRNVTTLARLLRLYPQVNGLLRRLAGLGLFQAEEFEAFIDDLLRQRLPHGGQGAPSRPLTFGDFYAVHYAAPSQQPALFLAVTDVGRRAPLLIDSLSPAFAAIEVAKAVRASAGFPIFLRPACMTVYRDARTGLPAAFDASPNRPQPKPEAGRFVDGGIVVNFPLWLLSDRVRESLYREGRLLRTRDDAVGTPDHPLRAVAFRPLTHIGLRLVERSPDSAARGEPKDGFGDLRDPRRFYRALYEMLVGGVRTTLEDVLVRKVQRALLVEQPHAQTGTDAQVLDFHKLTPRIMADMFDAGRSAARRALRGLSFELPSADAPLVTGPPSSRIGTIQELLRSLRGEAQRVLRGLGALEEGKRPHAVRVNVFVPQQRTLALRYAENMDGDPDERLVLPDPGWGVTGLCFAERHVVLCNRELALAEGHGFAHRTQEMGLLVDPPPNWMLCTPIIDPYEPFALPHDEDARHLSFIEPVGLRGERGRSLLLVRPAALGVVLGVLTIDALTVYGAADTQGDGSRLPAEPRHQAEQTDVQWLFILAQEYASHLGATLGRYLGRRKAER